MVGSRCSRTGIDVFNQILFTFAVCALDEACQPCISKRPQDNHREAIPLGEGPVNPHEEARGKPPGHGQRSEQPGIHSKKSSCTVGPSCRQASYTTIAQSLALLKNTLSRVAGVKTRSKQLPAIPVTANAMLKIGGKLSWANRVKCTRRRVSSSRPRRL